MKLLARASESAYQLPRINRLLEKYFELPRPDIRSRISELDLLASRIRFGFLLVEHANPDVKDTISLDLVHRFGDLNRKEAYSESLTPGFLSNTAIMHRNVQILRARNARLMLYKGEMERIATEDECVIASSVNDLLDAKKSLEKTAPESKSAFRSLINNLRSFYGRIAKNGPIIAGGRILSKDYAHEIATLSKGFDVRYAELSRSLRLTIKRCEQALYPFLIRAMMQVSEELRKQKAEEAGMPWPDKGSQFPVSSSEKNTPKPNTGL